MLALPRSAARPPRMPDRGGVAGSETEMSWVAAPGPSSWLLPAMYSAVKSSIAMDVMRAGVVGEGRGDLRHFGADEQPAAVVLSESLEVRVACDAEQWSLTSLAAARILGNVPTLHPAFWFLVPCITAARDSCRTAVKGTLV